VWGGGGVLEFESLVDQPSILTESDLVIINKFKRSHTKEMVLDTHEARPKNVSLPLLFLFGSKIYLLCTYIFFPQAIFIVKLEKPFAQ
jgi:hypothetical protein